jgi:hypothetical protein
MRLSALRTALLSLVFAGTSSMAQGIAPSDNAPQRQTPADTLPSATEQQALPGTATEPMNISPSETETRRALAECDSRPVDEQQTCRDNAIQQSAPEDEGNPTDGGK